AALGRAPLHRTLVKPQPGSVALLAGGPEASAFRSALQPAADLESAVAPDPDAGKTPSITGGPPTAQSPALAANRHQQDDQREQDRSTLGRSCSPGGALRRVASALARAIRAAIHRGQREPRYRPSFGKCRALPALRRG